MKLFNIDRTILLGLVLTLTFLFVPPAVFSQAEKLGAVQYTPVKGWKKTAKDNMVSFSELNEATGKFCIITLYGATPSTGKPEGDFVRDWNERVVKTLGAQGEPKTETEAADGWTMIAGGTSVDYQGTKALVFLSVMSGHGKTVSVLGLLNDEVYLPKIVAFNTSIDVDKTVAAVTPTQTAAPAQVVNGKLVIPPISRQLSLADIAGEWGQNDGINTRYVYRDTGGYAGYDSLHFTDKMTFTARGEFHSDFFSLQNSTKIKEQSSGTVAVDGRMLYIKQQGKLRKYVIRGWLELPDITILEVCGPWFNDDVIPAAIFTDPNQGANLDKKFVRKK